MAVEQPYEAPAVEDRTSVDEPLNTARTISDGQVTTPKWRRKRDQDESAEYARGPSLRGSCGLIDDAGAVLVVVDLDRIPQRLHARAT